MATRMQQRRGTAEQWTLANPVLATGEIGFETDTSKFKVGDGVNAWATLAYFVNSDDLSGELEEYATQEFVTSAIENVVGFAPETLDTLVELASALGDDPNFSQTILITADEFDQAAKAEAVALAEAYTDAEIATLSTTLLGADSEIIQSVDELSTIVQATSATVDGHITELSVIDTDIANQGVAIDTINTALTSKAPSENPTFTGTVTLPATTLVGDVTSAEIGHLAGVTDPIQGQIDAKLDSGEASGTFAPLNDPTFGGTVSLPSTTSIGEVSSTQLGHLNGVTSSIQTQLSNLDTTKANIESPTFTGTVSGVTSSMVGLGSVDNTSDADKPVSTATQTALDSRLALAGGTMTGKITLDGDPTQALHAVTKQYADAISEGLSVHAAVVALSDSDIDLTGATPTTVIDGVTLAEGDRVIVNGQTVPEQNGIYVYEADDSGYVRAEDFDEPGEVAGGDFVFVLSGSTYGGTGWVKTSDSIAVINTDPINFTQFSGPGSITAGTNVAVVGTQVSVVDSPVFSGTVDASAAGVEFSDGVQTQAGVPSLTAFVVKTADYTLDTLDHKDNVVEINMSTAGTFTVPLNATLTWPVGASLDVFATGTGEITIAGEAGVILNATPGLKLRTQFSSATIMKRGPDSWIVYGDLKA